MEGCSCGCRWERRCCRAPPWPRRRHHDHQSGERQDVHEGRRRSRSPSRCTDATVECTAHGRQGRARWPTARALDTNTARPELHHGHREGRDGDHPARRRPTTSSRPVAAAAAATCPPTLDHDARRADRRSRRSSRASPQDYTATLAAQILSTAGDATLSVGDAERRPDRSPGQRRVLPAGRRCRSPAPARPHEGQPTPAPVFAPVGGSAAPTTVLTYDGPLNETDTLTFKQPIGAGDSLRTGAVQQDAHLHALDHEPVVDRRHEHEKGAPRGAPFLLLECDCRASGRRRPRRASGRPRSGACRARRRGAPRCPPRRRRARPRRA